MTAPRTIYTPALGSEAAQVLADIAAAGGATSYDFGADQYTAPYGTPQWVRDLTPYLVRTSSTGGQVPTITRDNTAEIPARIDFALDLAPAGVAPISEPAWGYDLIAPYMLVFNSLYSADWQRFPLGMFVLTSPQLDPQPNAPRVLAGYEMMYLLQGDIGDTFVCNSGEPFHIALANLFFDAGVTGAYLSGALDPSFVNFPGDFKNKTAADDIVFPCDSSNTYTYIEAINLLLSAAGCRPLFTDQLGKFSIEYLVDPATVAQQWTFSRQAGNQVVLDQGSVFASDVYGIPNQWVFIQQGLTFAPVEGSGQYTVNNKPGDPHYQPPSDQGSTSWIRRSVQFLPASGQADLVAQGDAIVKAQLSQSEKITIPTDPWPAAWHYDVFTYVDDAMPRSNTRKVQAQGWTLPLTGDAMSWSTVVVAPQ